MLSKVDSAKSSPMFSSAKLKVQRAKSHILELTNIIKAFMSTDFYTVTHDTDPNSGCPIIKIATTNNAPDVICLAVGDAIHNLRAALDHCAHEITGSDTHYFPFHMERENLISPEGKIVCRNTNLIEQFAPGLGDFIVNEIRPYKAGHPLLWPLTKIDAIDKHRLIIPATYATSVLFERLYDPINRFTIERGTITLGPGSDITAIKTPNRMIPEGKIEATFDVFFGEATFMKDEPVIPTLMNAADAVSETLCRIEEFLA